MKYSSLLFLALIVFTYGHKIESKSIHEGDCEKFSKEFIEVFYPKELPTLNGSLQKILENTSTEQMLEENIFEEGDQIVQMYKSYFLILKYCNKHSGRKRFQDFQKSFEECKLGDQKSCNNVLTFVPYVHGIQELIKHRSGKSIKDSRYVEKLEKEIIEYSKLVKSFLYLHPEYLNEFKNLSAGLQVVWKTKEHMEFLSKSNSGKNASNISLVEKVKENFLFLGNDPSELFSFESSKKHLKLEEKWKDKDHKNQTKHKKKRLQKARPMEKYMNIKSEILNSTRPLTNKTKAKNKNKIRLDHLVFENMKD